MPYRQALVLCDWTSLTGHSHAHIEVVLVASRFASEFSGQTWKQTQKPTVGMHVNVGFNIAHSLFQALKDSHMFW